MNNKKNQDFILMFKDMFYKVQRIFRSIENEVLSDGVCMPCMCTGMCVSACLFDMGWCFSCMQGGMDY